MVCGQEILLRCIPVPLSTTVVSYVLTIHMRMYVCTYLPSNHHRMPYLLPYTQHKNHLHSLPTYLPMDRVTTYILYLLDPLT